MALALLSIAASLLLVLALTASCLHWIGLVLPAAPFEAGATVVVLGGGVRGGRLTALGRARVAAGVAASQSNRPVLFTGGLNDARAEADLMAPVAIEIGLSPELVLREGKSRTTLQNALFSRDTLRADQVILVSDRFHLPRAAMLFRWAGFRIAGFAPSDYKSPPQTHLWLITREALSFWLNLARIASWHLAGLIGIPRSKRIKWLT